MLVCRCDNESEKSVNLRAIINNDNFRGARWGGCSVVQQYHIRIAISCVWQDIGATVDVRFVGKLNTQSTTYLFSFRLPFKRVAVPCSQCRA